MAATLEPIEFRSPIATIKFNNGSEMPLIFDPVWQRRFKALWDFVETIDGGSEFLAAGVAAGENAEAGLLANGLASNIAADQLADAVALAGMPSVSTEVSEGAELRAVSPVRGEASDGLDLRSQIQAICSEQLAEFLFMNPQVGGARPFVGFGQYTPTVTALVNISAVTAYLCQYARIGNVVIISGRFDADPTAAGDAILSISLPEDARPLTGFSATNNGGGVAFSPAVASLGASIYADNTELWVEWIAVDTANRAFYFVAFYLIT